MKTLYILGTHPHVDNVKFGLKNTEYWGVSPLLMNKEKNYDSKLNLVFEIHRKDEYSQDTAPYIYDTNLPVLMRFKDKKVKKCVVIPYSKYLKKYGDYVTNSITIMLWHAIEEGYKNIIIAGVEFLHNREATIERPNLEYWVGYFRAKGITINVPKESYLLKTKYVYGIDNILLQIKKQKERINELEEFKYRYYYRLVVNDFDHSQKYKSDEEYKKDKEYLATQIAVIESCIAENEVLLRMI